MRNFLSNSINKGAAVLLLLIVVGTFWIAVVSKYPKLPMYGGNEAQVLQETDLNNVFKFRDYGGYFRFSPSGLILTSVLHKHIVKPMSGDESKLLSEGTVHLVPLYLVCFILMSVCFYLFLKAYVGSWAAFFGAVYLGTNFNLYYFFAFVSCITACLLVMYSIGLIFCTFKYIESRKKHLLIGYYAFFILLVCAWEQWVNLVPFLCLIGMYLYLRNGRNKKDILNFIITPIVTLILYAAARQPFTIKEMTIAREAQFVFSYPSKKLMLEEMVSNMSYHIANSIESLFYPWPSLSFASIEGLDMNKLNAYNSTYTNMPNIHYFGFPLWYAAVLFTVFCVVTFHHFKNVYLSNIKMVSLGTVGLLLTWFGFAAHIPLMHRTYFIMPGYLIGFKHAISILGFSIYVSWFVWHRFENKFTILQYRLVCSLLCIWVIYCNYSKISQNLIQGFR